MQRISVLIFIFALLVVIGGLIFWAVGGTSEPAKQEPEIISFEVERPDLVVTTRSIDSVTIFGVAQESNGTSTSGDIELGEATRESESGETSEWRLAIPEEPLPIASIYAKGYDEEGNELAQKSLPHTGSRAVYEALWLDEDQQGGTSHSLSVGEEIQVGDVTVTLNEVTEDTRCGPNASCPEPTVKANVTFASGDDKSQDVEISLNDQTTVGSHILQILEVSPEVTEEMESGEEIAQDEYELRILVFREAKL